MKEMSDLFCSKAAVGGNYNLTRDTIYYVRKSLFHVQNLTVYQDAIIGKDFDGLNADGIQTHIDQYIYGYGAEIV